MYQTTSQLGNVQGVKGLIYGKAGIGKTRLAATVPNCLIIATEPGLLSLNGFNIPYIEAKTVAQLNDIARWIHSSAEAKQFGSFYFDSLSETLEIIVAEERPKAGKEPRRAYNELLIQATALIKSYRDLSGPNIFFTAKQSKSQDGDTGMMLYGPKMPGKAMGDESPYLFDFVFNLYVYVDPATQSRQWLFRTQPDNQYEAKDRSGRLAPIEPADLGYIVRKVMGA